MKKTKKLLITPRTFLLFLLFDVGAVLVSFLLYLFVIFPFMVQALPVVYEDIQITEEALAMEGTGMIAVYMFLWFLATFILLAIADSAKFLIVRQFTPFKPLGFLGFGVSLALLVFLLDQVNVFLTLIGLPDSVFIFLLGLVLVLAFLLRIRIFTRFPWIWLGIWFVSAICISALISSMQSLMVFTGFVLFICLYNMTFVLLLSRRASLKKSKHSKRV